MKVSATPRFALLVLALAAASLAILAALINYANSLGPLDLAAARQGSTIAIDRNGRLLRAFTTTDGRWRLPVAKSEVDPRFVSMLIAYEDHKFAKHDGVDVIAFGRAALQWIEHGRIVSGGSTLTMQVARLIEPRAERSIGAKIGQILRALEIERRAGKAGVIDLYLSLAPYGGNLEGVRAASLAYFGKEPKRLSIAEAAMLVALPQSPETRRPDRFPAAARAARDMVLRRALSRGVITPAERELASREAVPTQRRAFAVLAPHASEAALRNAPGQRIHRLTLDARLQASLETLVKENVQRLGPRLSAALLVIDNASGEVRAHVGSADYFSQERAGSIDMTQAFRSPGSTLKPFIYALAFENGLAHPETLLDDRPTRYGAYAPQNFDLSFQGAVTARRALQLSLNLPAIELLAEIGPARLLARLRNAGAAIALRNDAAPGLAVALGGLGVKLRDIATLYAGLARGGRVPALIESEAAAATPKAEPHRISEPVASWYVADILRGAAPPVNAPAGLIAYKTGTSYGYRDAFAFGFDKAYTVAVWVGRPDNSAVPGLVGREVAAPILFDAFARLEGAHAFPSPPANILVARTSALPPPLRRFSANARGAAPGSTAAPLKIVFPPDGARIDLGLAGQAQTDIRLALKAEGGAPPLTWIINGAPLGEPDLRRQASWAPDGVGFVRVSIIDAGGATDSVLVRVE